MFWVQLCVMFGVVFVVCMVALGGDGGLGRAYPDRPEVAMPPDRLMVRPDVDSLRFSTGVRGYRMDEVDDVLDRLAAELQVRDDYIAQLQAKLTDDDHPASVPSGPGGDSAAANTPPSASAEELGAWATVAAADRLGADSADSADSNAAPAPDAATTAEDTAQPPAEALSGAHRAPAADTDAATNDQPADAPPSEKQ